MSIETETAESDAQAVFNHVLYKQPLDPETYQRVHRLRLLPTWRFGKKPYSFVKLRF